MEPPVEEYKPPLHNSKNKHKLMEPPSKNYLPPKHKEYMKPT